MTRAPGLSVAGILMALALAGCGFTPLYAEPGVVGALSGVEVRAPDTRTGYILRERLEDALGRNGGQPPAYRLTTQVRERRSALGARADDTATRYELALTVSYTLADMRGARLYGQTLTVTTTYAASDQPYAGVVAQQDGEERAAAQAADLIRADLARFFAERAPAG